MADAKVAVTHANGNTPAVGGVFDGRRFFLIQRLPSRTSFVQRIQANGGRVVKLESQADHIIADHVRRDSPAGSISYTFIEDAIKDGVLPNPSDHRAGPAQGTVRESGSAIPQRGTRTPFTHEDDRVLRQWVEQGVKKGNREKGNELYKQLEQANPRHTYQAWRDRYIKYLMGKPARGADVTVSANAPPSPPTAQDEQEMVAEEPVAGPSGGAELEEAADTAVLSEQIDVQDDVLNEDETTPEFTDEDREMLLAVAGDIVNIHPSQLGDAWRKWAEEYPPHSARAWRKFWRDDVKPIYLKRIEAAEEELAVAGPSSQTSKPSASRTRSASPESRKRTRDGEHVSSPQKKSRIDPEVAAHTERTDIGRSQDIQAADATESNAFSTQVIEILSTDRESQETTTPASRHESEDTAGNLLTEENLANQQAQHRAQLLRGADLPEDDENNNGEQLDVFRQMLEDMTKTASQSQLPALTGNVLEASNELLQPIDMPQDSQRPISNLGGFEPISVDDLMSSQQEIDDVFEANINWPESPKVSQKAVQSQSLQFETQIDYPNLPSQAIEDSQLEDFIPPDQPSISYPSLPEVLSQAPISEQTALNNNDRFRSLEPEDSWIEVEHEDDESSELLSEDSSLAGGIDLSIPEPQGGWNSSSPAKPPTDQLDGAGRSTSDQAFTSDHANVNAEAEVSGSEAEVFYEIYSGTSPSSPSSSEREASISDDGTRTQRPRNMLATQDILNAETQQPDFNLPLPSDSEDSASEQIDEERTPTPGRNWSKSEDELLLHGIRRGMSSPEIVTAYELKRSPSAVRSRRAILSKQNPDILSPRRDEDESDVSSQDPLPSDPLEAPPFPPSPHQSNALESQNLSDDAEAYEAYFIKKTHLEKYSAAAVNEALRRTSMRAELADLVLLETKAGRGLPGDVPGIWSEEDDQALEGGDARRIRALEDKHGWDEFMARSAFLEELREA